MTNAYKNIGNLKVSEILADFVNKELLEGTNLKPEKFWKGFDKVIHELAPKNKELINICLLYTSPSPRDGLLSRMPSSA